MQELDFALQQAIYTRLAAVLTPLGAALHDEVPDQKAYPFCVVGQAELEQFDTDDTHGYEAMVVIDTWSTYAGMKECKNLMGAIYESLHDNEFAVTGGTIVLCQLDYSGATLDPDGLTRHGVQRFRILITEA